VLGTYRCSSHPPARRTAAAASLPTKENGVRKANGAQGPAFLGAQRFLQKALACEHAPVGIIRDSPSAPPPIAFVSTASAAGSRQRWSHKISLCYPLFCCPGLGSRYILFGMDCLARNKVPPRRSRFGAFPAHEPLTPRF
jgi:hypothetical protein